MFRFSALIFTILGTTLGMAAQSTLAPLNDEVEKVKPSVTVAPVMTSCECKCQQPVVQATPKAKPIRKPHQFKGHIEDVE